MEKDGVTRIFSGDRNLLWERYPVARGIEGSYDYKMLSRDQAQEVIDRIDVSLHHSAIFEGQPGIFRVFGYAVEIVPIDQNIERLVIPVTELPGDRKERWAAIVSKAEELVGQPGLTMIIGEGIRHKSPNSTASTIVEALHGKR